MWTIPPTLWVVSPTLPVPEKTKKSSLRGAGTMLLRITDRTDSQRTAVVDGTTVLPVIGAWLHADGALGSPSKNVLELESAVRHGDWRRVHVLADFLSFDVSAAVEK